MEEKKSVISFFENHYPNMIHFLESELKPITYKIYENIEKLLPIEEEVQEHQKIINKFFDQLQLKLTYVKPITDTFLDRISIKYILSFIKDERVKKVMGILYDIKEEK
jgi:hypothetical protein